MDMVIDFPGGDRVDAHLGSFTVRTDQPHRDGGDKRRHRPLILSWLHWVPVQAFTCLDFAGSEACRQRASRLSSAHTLRLVPG